MISRYSCLLPLAPCYCCLGPSARTGTSTCACQGRRQEEACPEAKPAGPPAVAAENGPCSIGVIPLTGNEFGVQQVGFTAFGNEYTSVPVDSWGLDDLVVSRVRAAAGGRSVRRIAYSKDDLARMKEFAFDFSRS